MKSGKKPHKACSQNERGENLRTYKIGVVGLGARAETFTRQLYTGQNKRAQLFGLCDIDPDRMKKYMEYCGHENVRTFTNTEEFMNQPDMDAVIITTPDFTHVDVAKMAFKAGKHVYLEKPIAVTAEKCREIMRAHASSGVAAYVGFNLRASRIYAKARQILRSNVIGKVIHIQAQEQLSQAHGASFMRRFHRKRAQSGGILNHKCCHDLDIMQWLIGHEHKVAKVASFGGVSVFDPAKSPAKFCHECPRKIYHECPYKDKAGFVFPVRGEKPIHKTVELNTYGGDLCVYNREKELIDNQTLILEWDNGVRGNFNLQLFQNKGKRELKVWGEKGLLEAEIVDKQLAVTLSDTGEVIEYKFPHLTGGHGGVDPFMLSRFIAAIDNNGEDESCLSAGLAATMVAEKADESMETGKVVTISPKEYGI